LSDEEFALTFRLRPQGCPILSRTQPPRVVPGLVPGIHAVRKPPNFESLLQRLGVRTNAPHSPWDGRDKPGQDAERFCFT
jgi:hypothetical protein